MNALHFMPFSVIALLALFALLLMTPVYCVASPVAMYVAGPQQSGWHYSLGRGLQMRGTGFTLGGYASMQYEDGPERLRRFKASTLSSLIAWQISSRLQFFSELELEDFAIVDERRSLYSRSDTFEIERLYIDFFWSDALALRVGKFLTPVGRWNEQHAAPLVWTTSRPLVTSHPFAENTTGGMFHGLLTSFGRDFEYAVYIAFPEDVDPDQEDGPFGEAIGARLQYPIGSVEIGLSYIHFLREEEIGLGDERDLRENLLGIDFFWTHNGYELGGEGLYRMGDSRSGPAEAGLFIQGVAPLTRRLFAIGRYEFFDPAKYIKSRGAEEFAESAASAPGLHVWVIALAFRPIPALILKAEYSLAHNHTYNDVTQTPEGFMTSISVLF